MNLNLKDFKLPIPYKYCILISVGAGLVTGMRQIFLYVYFFEDTPDARAEVMFSAAMLNQILWGFLVPAVYWLYLNFGSKKNNLLRLSKSVFIGSIIVAAFHEFSSYIIWFIGCDLVNYKEFTSESWAYMRKGFPAGFISQWMAFWMIYAIFAALDYAKRLTEKQMELANMKVQLSDAQLNALRYQLQPHFLFNTLNTISSLMEFDKKDAQRVVTRLGNLLRTILEKDPRRAIPLQEELSFIESYLGIEETRFHDRLEIVYEIEENVKSAKVPKFILQPLVENAIKHGLASKIENGIVKVNAKSIENNRIQISVSDNGKGTDVLQENLTEKGIGLQNVKERLDLTYGEDYSMIINSKVGLGFEIILKIPRGEINKRLYE